MSEKLELEYSGVLTKLQSATIRENRLCQVQIKCTDNVEINHIFRELTKWGVEDIENVPNIAFGRITIPLEEYRIFVSTQFAINPYNPTEVGTVLDGKLASLSLVRKFGKDNQIHMECCLNFLKNEENKDIDDRYTYLKHKEEDENGKKRLQIFRVKSTECERFLLGRETPDEDAGSDETDIGEVQVFSND